MKKEEQRFVPGTRNQETITLSKPQSEKFMKYAHELSMEYEIIEAWPDQVRYLVKYVSARDLLYIGINIGMEIGLSTMDKTLTN